MRSFISFFSLVAVCSWSTVFSANAQQVNVTQEHNHLSRDGVYIEPAFTPAAAAQLMRDLNFDGTISGHVYAQPLYIDGGPNGPMLIAVTESNNVYALNPITGTVIWQRTDLGPAVTSGLPCGNINPVGITGTPVVDLASRKLFFDALIDGTTKKHFIFSLNVDTGATTAGWPVDVSATANYNGMPFNSLIQEERGALALVNGIVYVPYSGYAGDCEDYHGWVVGVDINDPANVHAWATDAVGGGIWGHGGVASDGTNMFVVTGNTFNTGGNWMGGEAIIRLQAGPTWSGQPTGYWAPLNWFDLDNGDTDLGGVSATLIDVPGATPSQLVLALGKDSNAYLVNRNNLGGIALPVAQANVSGINRGTSAVTYRTGQGTYFAFHNDAGAIKAYRITPTSPPTILPVWSMNQNGRGSPWVTTTDGTSNFIVWVAGVEGDQRLHGYDGDTGAVVYAGGGANELMTGTRQWNTGIAARGRIYFAADNKVYAFRLPTGTPTPTPAATATPTATPTSTPSVTPTGTPAPSPTATPTSTPTATPPSTPTPSPTSATAIAMVADFNGDGHPDVVVRNPSTHQTVLAYLNNNVVIGAEFGPTLPAAWGLRGVADFNLDTHPDYALFNSSTAQTAIAYLSGPTVIGAAFGSTLPAGWKLVATADFNGDGHPDYVIYNGNTHQTIIGYLDNNVVIGAAFGPTLPGGWSLTGVADFNRDGQSDYALFNLATGQTAIAYLSGPTVIGAAFGPSIPSDWQLMAAADFDGDGFPDYFLYKPSTRQTVIWYLNNNIFVNSAFGPTLPAGWTVLWQ
jgi:hypothetical protein